MLLHQEPADDPCPSTPETVTPVASHPHRHHGTGRPGLSQPQTLLQSQTATQPRTQTPSQTDFLGSFMKPCL